MDLAVLARNLGVDIFRSIEILAMLIVLATVITCHLPSRSKNRFLNWVLHILNLVAGNVGHNRNADDQ